MATAALRPVTPLGLLAAELEELRLGLRDVAGVTAEQHDALARACELAGGLDPYLGRCTTPESPALAALARRTQEADWGGAPAPGGQAALEAEMLSGHVEGQALKMLVHLTRARRVLELGMFTGYSALAMAEALPEGGVVVACELDAEVAAFARECFAESPAGARVDVRVGPGGESLAALAGGEPFDLVFIDADKGGYLDYLTTVLDVGLLAAGGLVCVDNTLMQGQPWLSGEATENGAAVAAFNAAVAADARLEQVLLPLRDGLTLIRRA